MIFNSLSFILFFLIVFIIYYILDNKYRYIVLLIASYVFYAFAGFKYIFLLLIITLISYLFGSLISKTSDEKKKKMLLLIFIIINIICLIYFKYLGFFVNVFNRIFFSTFSIENIVVPLGISFYVLQAITYPVDVYRGHVDVEKNFLRFALFVSFFPQILSGPIEKSKKMLPQFREDHYFNYRNVFNGFIIMLYGFFQKIVVADLLAYGVNNVFDNLKDYNGIPLIIAVFLYSFQIYFDFCSYSNIARGCAKVFGFDLTNNFNNPYFADSIKNFWGRWHISLSSWFKEYLYFPLGGNKKGNVRTYFNIVIVFLISGLWHGANYTYIIWGLLHGLYQVIERVINKRSRYKIINVIVTYLLVVFAWIFFRANCIGDVGYIIINIFKVNFIDLKTQILSIGFDTYDLKLLLISMVFIFIVDLIKEKKNILNVIYNSSSFFKVAVVLVLAFWIIIFGHYGPGYDNSQFIYLGY